MAGRSRLRGIGRVRRLMRRLSSAVGQEVIVELSVTGRRMLSAVLARTPRRRGALASGVSQRVLPRSLRLQIGLLGTPSGRARLFYGRIQDLGRREQQVRVTRRGGDKSRSVPQAVAQAGKERLRRRGPNKGTPIGSPYVMRVRGAAGKRFITGRYPDLRAELNQNLRGIFGRALQRAGGGADD